MTLKQQQDYIKKVVGKYTKDKWLSSELVQTSLIRIFKNNPNYTTINQYKKYINIVVDSVYIDHFRKEQTIKKAKDKYPYENTEPLLTSDKKFIEEEIVEHNNKKYCKIWKAINLLPDTQKDVILLRYFFKMKVRKISEVMHANHNTTLGRIHKAKANIIKIYKKNKWI